jgi:hypothetical protein
MPEDPKIPFSAGQPQHLFKGPANWFTLRVPGDLHIEQTEAFLEVHPAAVSVSEDAEDLERRFPWSMTLYAAWVDDNEPETRAASFDPANLFPKVLNSARVAPLTVTAKCQTWAGTSVRPTSGAWWKWLLSKPKPYAWRLWIIEYKDIIVVASLQAKSGVPLPANDVAACESLLNSIRFAEVLARPPELFRSDVIALARKHFPLLTTVASENFSVRISDSNVNLANFYRSYIHEPERLQQIVLPGLTTVVRLQEWGPEQLMPPLEDVADRIMPMLYPETDADSSLAEFVSVPWVGGLTIMFVLDEDSTYRFVHMKMLEMWQLSVDDLEELAMENLELYARDNPLEVTLIGEGDDPRMLVPVQPNAYNSVRLLGDHLHSRLRQMLGAELVVGVPNRDFFVAVSLKHPQLVGQVQQRVIEDYQSMHHPLTQRLLVISADGVSEYCED